MAQMNLSTEKKIMDLENRFVAAWGEREGVGGIGSSGLMDANYCFWKDLQWDPAVQHWKLCVDTYIATQQWEEKVCTAENINK